MQPFYVLAGYQIKGIEHQNLNNYMAIYRTQRLFAAVPPQQQISQAQEQPGIQQVQGTELPSPRDLQLENMKMQRQIMQNQRIAQQLSQQERQAQYRKQYQIQRLEAQKDAAEKRQQIQEKRLEKENESNPGRQSLVKKNTTALKPIPMK